MAMVRGDVSGEALVGAPLNCNLAAPKDNAKTPQPPVPPLSFLLTEINRYAEGWFCFVIMSLT